MKKIIISISFIALIFACSKSGSSISPTSITTDPLTNGLVAYYPFDGNANDASGNGNNGQIGGNLTFEDAHLGKGAKFNGTTDLNNPSRILIPSSSSLNFTDAFTIIFWAKVIEDEGASYIDNDPNPDYTSVLPIKQWTILDRISPKTMMGYSLSANSGYFKNILAH